VNSKSSRISKVHPLLTSSTLPNQSVRRSVCSRLSIPSVPVYMLCNSRTRSRVLAALGNAKVVGAYQSRGVASCRTAWKAAVVYHCCRCRSSTCIPVQLRFPAAAVGHCVMWPRVYHQRKREHTHTHTHGILHLRSQARGFSICLHLCDTNDMIDLVVG
jgi:hypothetical protein